MTIADAQLLILLGTMAAGLTWMAICRRANGQNAKRRPRRPSSLAILLHINRAIERRG